MHVYVSSLVRGQNVPLMAMQNLVDETVPRIDLESHIFYMHVSITCICFLCEIIMKLIADCVPKCIGGSVIDYFQNVITCLLTAPLIDCGDYALRVKARPIRELALAPYRFSETPKGTAVI